MKKLLIMLMVVAMASFLFVGCLGTTPPIEPDEPVEPVEPVVPATVAPVITWVSTNPLDPLEQKAVISLTSTAAQYVNKAESTWGIIVHGTAPTYSEVKVYLNGIVAGTADTLAGGTWSVVIALSELGADGAKTLDADAIEPGCEVSVKSNAVSFILDRTLPTMTAIVRVVEPGYFRVKFSEDVNTSAAINLTTTGPWPSALNPNNWAACGDQFVVYGPGSTDVITHVSWDVREIIFTPGTGSTLALAFVTTPILNSTYYVSCRSVEDLAGNAIAGATTTILTSARVYGIVLP